MSIALLLPDAETAENPFEDIFSCGLAGNFAKRGQRGTKFERYPIGKPVARTGVLGGGVKMPGRSIQGIAVPEQNSCRRWSSVWLASRQREARAAMKSGKPAPVAAERENMARVAVHERKTSVSRRSGRSLLLMTTIGERLAGQIEQPVVVRVIRFRAIQDENHDSGALNPLNAPAHPFGFDTSSVARRPAVSTGLRRLPHQGTAFDVIGSYRERGHDRSLES